MQKLVSIKDFLPKLYRDLGFSMDNTEIQMSHIIEWVIEAMQHIGAYPQFCQKVESIEVDDYKGSLPCDFYKLIRLTSNGRQVYYNSDLSLDRSNSRTKSNSLRTFNHTLQGYNINFDTITSSNSRENITVEYLAFPVDEEGLPMIVEDVSNFDAFFWKVVYQLNIQGFQFKSRYLNDLNFVRQKWNFYCTQARAELNMGDLEMWNKIKNMWLGFNTKSI